MNEKKKTKNEIVSEQQRIKHILFIKEQTYGIFEHKVSLSLSFSL